MKRLCLLSQKIILKSDGIGALICSLERKQQSVLIVLQVLLWKHGVAAKFGEF